MDTPNYYQFPNLSEPIHISRYLTSNGGQALQYIARATRLDGNNKGKPIDDLRKAVDLLEDEINRLTEMDEVNRKDMIERIQAEHEARLFFRATSEGGDSE